MFTDEDLGSVEFHSSWKKNRSLAQESTQTGDLETHDVACQSIKRKQKEIQCGKTNRREYIYENGKLVKIKVQTEDDYIAEEIDIQDYDSPDLMQFMNNAVPLMFKMLDRNARSRAFDEFNLASDEENKHVTCLHTLCYSEVNESLQITGLTWNATGSVIAASYGRHDHEDWCYHKSMLCTWNLDRRGMDPNKPDIVIDLPCCLTCIAFHPKKPAWIVGGTFNGEVIVWDTGCEDEAQIATSGIGDDSHREPVSKVQWVLDPDSKGKKYNVVSVSADGRILIWQVSERKGKLKLSDGFILLTESLPYHIRVKAKRGDQEMGVTCLSFNKEDDTTFLIGSESGGIFKCNRNSRGTPARREIKCSVDLRSPVTFTFSPHSGPVYAVECSPFHRNLFLSCGTDTTSRLYSVLLSQPITTVEPSLGYIYSVKWSPVRPMVFACVTESGHLLIYDMKTSRTVPVSKLDASPKKQPVYSLQFNHSNTDLLATGDANGYVQIWKLSGELKTPGATETAQLEEIGNVIASATASADDKAQQN